jgi:8-oxo-dGTP diphosphatase
MYPYTICFIKKGNELLLLNRNNTPNMGVWNGVGGKIEHGETVEESVKREVFEETTISLEEVTYKGIVSWNVNNEYNGGMYLFLAELQEKQPIPIITREGILAWKDISWILDPNNNGIVDNITSFLPTMLSEEGVYEYRCTYTATELVSVEKVKVKEGAPVFT